MSTTISPITPLIHMGGSNPDDLIGPLLDARQKLHELQECVKKTTPNQRDFQGRDYPLVLAAHAAVLNDLQRMAKHYDTILSEVMRQKGERDARRRR